MQADGRTFESSRGLNQHKGAAMQAMTMSMGATKIGNKHDQDYESFLRAFDGRFGVSVREAPLFKTDASGLWGAYLASFPESTRQFHNCCACRHFIERFGSLVTIEPNGATAPVVWNGDDVPEEYAAAFAALAKIVRKAKVTSVFLTRDAVLGQPETGLWRHFALETPKQCLHPKGLLTAGQKMAERREDHHTVIRALAEFPASAVDQALTLLKSDALYRSEKVLGQAEWLAQLHADCAEHHGRRSNVVWLAVATAPAGFCHPRSSMIGTLLEDIIAGIPFEEVSRKFKAKMSPILYQRPQAAPSAGQMAAAEKIMSELGAAGALARRFARLEEIETIWRPAQEPAKSSGGGIFDHLKPKGAGNAEPLVTTPQNITWEKFARTVLPEAKALELLVPAHGNFCALLTAENAEAPPILQWDSPERRNPFSWYVYHGGSPASRWGVSLGWARVAAVTLNPSMWHGGKFEHQGAGALFVLPGAKDSAYQQAGNAIFPETLKSEFHGIRSTIEAYSRGAKTGGYDEASACGLAINKGGAEATVRAVLANGTRIGYRIDRWD